LTVSDPVWIELPDHQDRILGVRKRSKLWPVLVHLFWCGVVVLLDRRRCGKGE